LSSDFVRSLEDLRILLEVYVYDLIFDNLFQVELKAVYFSPKIGNFIKSFLKILKLVEFLL